MNSGNRSDDSDSSDEDYNPEGQTEELPSEVESDGEPEDDLPTEGNVSKRGKKRQSKKPTKRRKRAQKADEIEVETDEKEHETRVDELTEVEKKKKADSLWADFMSDTNFKSKPKPTVEGSIKCDTVKVTEKVEKKKPVEEPKKVKVTQIFEFAGEEVKVMKEVAVDSVEARLFASSSTSQPGKAGVGKGKVGLGGLSSVLSQLGKKQKISTLEKTKLDWERFKKEEDLDDEIQSHNKGKDGYLDRQDFLERADLRRFEIEKEVRTVQRSNRMT